jgi:hypothetical protein
MVMLYQHRDITKGLQALIQVWEESDSKWWPVARERKHYLLTDILLDVLHGGRSRPDIGDPIDVYLTDIEPHTRVDIKWCSCILHLPGRVWKTSDEMLSCSRYEFVERGTLARQEN